MQFRLPFLQAMLSEGCLFAGTQCHDGEEGNSFVTFYSRCYYEIQ